MVDLFDADAMYDDDYLHFFAASRQPAGGVPTVPGFGVPDGSDVRSDADVEVIARLAGPDRLRPGAAVLDLGCGHGRIANRLAGHGVDVTGLDVSTVFLDHARADAAARGVDVRYLEGDMRALPWTADFDVVVNWATAFGYFDDDTNRGVLAQVHRALRPGGLLVMDLNNAMSRLRAYVPSRVTAHRPDGDLLADRDHLDPLTNRLVVDRTVVRDGRARAVRFVVRLFGFPELRDWLLAAGFTGVAGHGEDGRPLSAEHERLVVTAVRVG